MLRVAALREHEPARLTLP